ncbi:MAG: phosphate ABC transporter permease subunit PstC, partial [Merismopedia sp. SIO2A8]|nr:phosphate ABC transporter permease subunit PstC [Merismopedia sp. SIO2A8]
MTAELPLESASSVQWKPNRDRAKLVQTVVKVICGAFAAVSILTTFGIVAT